MAEIVITTADFRDAFPEFANETSYPDAYLERFITQSSAYISTTDLVLPTNVRTLAIEYMTAHLITLSAIDGEGNATGADGTITTSSSIGSVSVGIMAPIASTAFEQWIQSTLYGKNYWALLSANNPAPVGFIGNPRVFGIR